MKNAVILTILTFLLFAAARPGVADVLEIPLSPQAGAEPWDDHAVHFDAGGPLQDVTGLSLRLTGEGGGVPYVYCMDYRYSFTLAGRITVELRGEVPGLALGVVSHSFGSRSRAPFEITLQFDVEDFSFLEPGTGTLMFMDPAEMVSTPSGHFCPMGNGCVVTEAVLLVEYGGAVAEESTSWGVLKAIYR